MTRPTQYHRPTTLQEAQQLARQPGSIAIAGGALTFGEVLLPYDSVVDLQDIPQLNTIAQENGALLLGGAVHLQAVAEDTRIPAALRDALTRTLTPNLLNGASVAESLTAARPIVEWLAALEAAGATVQCMTGSGLDEYSVSAFLNLPDDPAKRGFVTQVILPETGQGGVIGTAFVARTPTDRPIINAAVFVRRAEDTATVTDARAVIAGASATVITVIDLPNLVGSPLDLAHIEHAVMPIPALVNPVADYKGSVAYRREMAQVCVRRALEACQDER